MLVFALCMAAPFANAENNAALEPSQHAGLMWNRSGLPAVFPLQVKTPPGQDYFLTLIDENTDAVLAAYIKGGAFFKVLVPPGMFRLRFAFGDIWQGEESLFGSGANTHIFELPSLLTFETRGVGYKVGYVVNLSEPESGQIAQVSLKDQLICQSIRFEFPSTVHSALEMDQTRGLRHQAWTKWRPGYETGLGEETFYRSLLRTDFHRYFMMPRYDVRSRYCG